ncbi:hypothetical protein B484DRAFT_123639 [Ochromonadaceae sp. CCMP2298]|nr:hypothetical protein B484DRAFT_123639 [Ochromonadaceae sp. CCMP2298]
MGEKAKDTWAGPGGASRGSHWWVVGAPCKPWRTATPRGPGQPPEVQQRRGERRRMSKDSSNSSMARGGGELAATVVLWGLQRCGIPPQRVASQRAAHFASGSTDTRRQRGAERGSACTDPCSRRGTSCTSSSCHYCCEYYYCYHYCCHSYCCHHL